VNLLLIGRAHSNVFDGQQTLSSTPATGSADTTTAATATAASSDVVVLRGITHKGPVGFLTLFEAYGHAAVGDRYKCPLHPVWVVCSESHYSVLFATQAQPVEVSNNRDLSRVIGRSYAVLNRITSACAVAHQCSASVCHCSPTILAWSGRD
jgi:Domain of unknown function (DUF4205)